MELIPIILAGGAGSRLWPVSREQHPKPFIEMDDGESLLQKTWLRAAQLSHVSEIITVTNEALYFKTQDHYAALNDQSLPRSFILEPFGRNTAPAILLAALQVAAKQGEQALLLVLAADHLISDQQAFASAVANATQLAQQDYLVTFGIQAKTPETGFGYIEAGTAIATVANAYHIQQFVEKPPLSQAQAYVDSGNYFWNSGMFCFQAKSVLAEFARYAPELLATARNCLDTAAPISQQHNDGIRLTAAACQQLTDISFDYAVMEHSTNTAVVSCNIGWSDIGSWQAISELKQTDQYGNSATGDTVLQDVSNCYIDNPARLVAAIGLDNLVIVDTTDALLIADKQHSQQVKEIVHQLKASGNELYQTHLTVHRPWGTYTVVEQGENFKIKRIVVKPGGRLSLQKHHHRSEHWIVVSGIAEVSNNGKEFLLNKNESTYIVASHKHRLANPGLVELIMIEVQSGEYLGEDDIVRFDDNYGRE